MSLKDYFYSQTKCRACQRDFSTSGNLKRHQKSSIACVNWIDNNLLTNEKYDNYAVDINEPQPRFSKDLIPFIDALDISSEQMIYKIIPKSDTSCKYCNREFSTVSALNKHQKSSVICDRWKQHDILENALRLASDIEYQSSMINHQKFLDEPLYSRESLITSAKRMRYTILEGKLYLIDKVLEPYLEDIQCIVDLSPRTPHTNPNVEYYTLPDKTRTNDDTTSKLIGMEAGCDWIFNKISENKKVAIFCTTGFQRSVPFLVWYLWKYVDYTLEYGSRAYDPKEFVQVVNYLDNVIDIKPKLFMDAGNNDVLANWIVKLFRDSGRECDYGNF